MTVGIERDWSAPEPAPLRVALVAGEHSGDALGARLMAALKQRLGVEAIEFSGVGGDEMAREGLQSLFPIEEVAVMGPFAILKGLPRIYKRVHQTVDAVIAARPDILVIIDSPEFTHPIAKRVRKRAPDIPIIDYVSPSVWAWRPGRARKMRAYVDHVLALLPFEPDAHKRLGGPPCSYVGHPLIERLDEIRNADAASLARRLGIDDGLPVLLVLPGSRRSEVDRMIDDFGGAVGLFAGAGHRFHVVIPAVRHLREKIEASAASWAVKPQIVDGASDKYAAMRLARAALAASGTVTLELALAGVPHVGAYKSDALTAAIVRRLMTSDMALLSNLVLGEKIFPELIQNDCAPGPLSNAISEIFADTPVRRRQLEALARVPSRFDLHGVAPSLAAADATLGALRDHPSAGKSRRG